MKKEVKDKKMLISFGIVLLAIIGLSVGFSAFQKQLFVSDIKMNVRIEENVRVSNIMVSKTYGDAVSNSEDYNKARLYGNVTFPNTSSYVLYKVDLTNFGNVKSGLLNITNNVSGTNYSICNSNGGSCSNNIEIPICNGSNCTLGSTKEIYIKVTSNTSGTKNINLDFDFEPYNNITYSYFQENTSSFKSEIMSNDTYEVTLTSDVEEVEVTGTASVSYNKNTKKLTISDVGSDITVLAKYKAVELIDNPSGNEPDNYVRYNNTLYRIISVGNVDDGYGNVEQRVKLISTSSIGNNQFDDDSNDFASSTIKDTLNTTFYNSLSDASKELIDTALWTEDYAGYVGLISASEYTSNSAWLSNLGYTLTIADDNKVKAVDSSGLIDSEVTVSRTTYPVIYLKTNALIIEGDGTSTNPFILDSASEGLIPNPTVITGINRTVTGSYMDLIIVSNKIGTPYYSTSTALNSENYLTDGNTGILTNRSVGVYNIYYYIPAGANYKAKSGRVTSRINGITYTVAYTKGVNIASIGKINDSCTTSGYTLSCNVTLPSITPNAGYENGQWSDGNNVYNPGASYTLTNSEKTLTANVSGKTYVATFNTNGATSVGEPSLYCTVTEGSTCNITLPSITREGFTIDGWSTNKDASSGVSTNSSVTLSDSVTYYALTHKDITLTFDKNGNTSQTPSGGSASTANTITQTCTIRNRATTCKITSPNITMSGFNIDGYTTGSTVYENYWTVNTQKDVNADATWYAQTSKAARTVTITFNKNGNAGQTPNGGSYTENTTVTESCVIAASRNGVAQAETCSITSPTITSSNGFNVLGYSEGATNRTISWNENTSKEVTANKTYYAQSYKAGKTVTITFAKNSNVSQTPNGASASTDTTITQTCNIAGVYNGATQDSSCSITSPTITAPDGFTSLGYSEGATNRTIKWNVNTAKNVSADKTYYAQSSKAGRTITVTFIVNGNGGSDETKTCDISTVYNGASQSASCSITSPDITPASGFTKVGWNSNQNDHTSEWDVLTSNNVSANKTYYAQSKKDGRTITITFDKNGNTSQTPSGGSASTANTITQTCDIATVYNGTTQANSCSVTSPTINAPSGFVVLGYSLGATNRDVAWAASLTKTVTTNRTYYAQSIKEGRTVTITFNKNGNTSQTPKNGSASTENTVSESCSISTVYNGATQDSTCSVTSPTINMSGFTVLGYSEGATNRTITWEENKAKDVSANKTYYAQTTKAAITRTLTFYKNGNQGFTYNSTTYTDTSKTFDICTIPAVYNGATQSSSCTSTITMATITPASGFTNIGWSTGASNRTATYTSGQTNVSLTMDANKSYYAQSIKEAKTITITFNKNSNSGQTPNGGSYTTNNTVTESCTIPAKYNGEAQATSCNVTSPTITAPSGFTSLGYSDGATDRTITWEENTSKSVGENKTYYAQSSKTGRTITITFNVNGNSGTNQTKTCDIDAVYNGATQASSCNITSPDITPASGFTNIGWNSNQNTHTSEWDALDSKSVSANKTYYAQTIKNGINRTMTLYKNGNTSFTYNGTTYTDTSKSFTICTIPAVYNGATQDTSCSATITMATITPASGFTNIGWSTGETNRTATYTSGQTSVTLSMDANKSFYAQSSKAGRTITITFNKNSNTGQTPNGGSYSTVTTITSSCNIPLVYNGSTQDSTCSITSPTITPPDGFTSLGYSEGATNRTITWEANTAKDVSANKTYYAQSTKAAKEVTVTFYKNGNVGQIPSGGSASTAAYVTQTCTIAAVYNGASQSPCSITSPQIGAPTGFTVDGYSTGVLVYEDYWQVNTSRTFLDDASFYAQTTKAAVTRTMTLYKNNNVGFTYNNTTYNDLSKTFDVCTIPAVHNGTTQDSSCSATITMATVVAPEGFTALGWSTEADLRSSTYTSGQTNAVLTMNSNKNYYAQSIKNGFSRYMTLYLNNNTSFYFKGTTYTDTSKKFMICSVPHAYNGESQPTSCSATIAMATITSPTGYTNNGWGTSANSTTPVYTSGQSGLTLTLTTDVSYYALKTIDDPVTPTITGGMTKLYNYSNTTLTCATTTTYATGTNTYYEFGYTTSTTDFNNGTINWLGNISTTATKSIGLREFHGTRYYTCRVYASDGDAYTTSLVQATTTTTMELVHSRIDLDATTNGGTIGEGTNPLYVSHYGKNIYTSRTDTTEATIPTASKSGWIFDGWYTINGIKVINPDGTVVENVDGWTSSGYWTLTSTSDTQNTHRLVAQFTPKTFTMTIYYNSNAQNGRLTVATKTTSCTVSTGSTCIAPIPAVVANSVGKYNSPFHGITSLNGMYAESLEIGADVTRYANYSKPLTIYYPNTSDGVSSVSNVLYRNEYFTSSSNMNVITSNYDNRTQQATNITLSGLKGTFKGITPNTNQASYMSISHTMVKEANISVWYAVTSTSENATFYYNSNTTSGGLTGATATSEVTSYYVCATATTVGISHGTTTTVPSEVSSSVGKYNSAYSGVAAAEDAMTTVSSFSGGSTYYVIYSSPITIYYPNTSNGVSSSNTALYRNEMFSNSDMSIVLSVSNDSTTQATLNDLVLSDIKGSLIGVNTTANTPNTFNLTASSIINSDVVVFYAIVNDSENVTFKYNSNTTSGSFTDASTTSSVTSAFYCASTSAIGVSHGSTTTVPTVVSSSVGKYNSPYKGISSSSTTISNATTFNGGSTYYTYYSQRLTIVYPSSTSACSTNSSSLNIFRNEYYTNASTMNTTISSGQASATAISSLTVSGILGTFKGLTPTVNSTSYTTIANFSSTYKDSSTTTYYAVSTSSENATFHYNSNTTSGSFTDATATQATTRTNYCTAATTATVSHGSTTTVPSAVSSSVGKYNSAYAGIANGTGTMTKVTSFTGGSTYYAIYSSALTIYYPNTSNGISSSNTALYRNEYFNLNLSDMNTITSNANNNTTQATTVTLSSIKGTFVGLDPTVNTYVGYNVNVNYITLSDTKTYYAVTTASENVTFKYNNNTTCGSVTLTTATQAVTSKYYCASTSAIGTSHGTTTTVPSAVSSSKGQYNSAYRAIAAVNSLTAVTTFTGGTTYYAVYSQSVTNYYYGSSYTSRTLYRNEYLASASATTYTAKLATSNTGTSDYSTAVGPGSSVWSGLSTAQDTTAEYSTVALAATSCSNTLYTVYTFNVTYAKGSNVSGIGSTSGSCKVTTSSTSCNVTLPTITAASGYTSVGWSTTNGATTGVTGSYTLSSNGTTLYANAQLPILMQGTNGNANSNFLRTTIVKNTIEKITFTNSISGHTVNGTNCWDVSRDQNGTVLAWATDTDSNGKYEITIGGNTKIYASQGSYLFGYLTYLTSLTGLQYLDTSNCTSMTYMFYGNKFTSIDLSHFNTSNVTDMSYMFYMTAAVTSLDLRSFDTSKVTTMASMFRCQSLVTLDLSSFNTSSVTSMDLMFRNNPSIEKIYVSSKFVTTSVPSSEELFTNTAYNSLTGLNGTVFSTSHLDKTYARIDGGTVTPGYFTTHALMAGEDTNASSNYLRTNVAKQNIEKIILTNSISGHTVNGSDCFDVSKDQDGTVLAWVTDTNSNGKKEITIGQAGGVIASSGYYLFEYLQNLTTIEGISYLNTTYATNMEHMFDYDTNLGNLSFSGFNTKNVTNMDEMFSGCEAMTSIVLTSFNTSNVTNMYGMFWGCTSATTINLNGFNTAKVTNMNNMFAQCEVMTSLNISTFNTSNVTDMAFMFNDCYAITSLNLSHFNTSKVTTFQATFGSCESLTSLNLSNWDTSKVTWFGSMFYGCSSITTLNLSHFNTSSAENIGDMFANCTNLTSVTLTSFNTSNVTYFGGMFAYCTSLTSIDISSFSSASATGTSTMFRYCSNLVTIYANSNFNVTGLTSDKSRNMFQGCTSIRGGNGTTYNSSYIDRRYARVDAASTPGYFTYKAAPSKGINNNDSVNEMSKVIENNPVVENNSLNSINAIKDLVNKTTKK